MCNGSAVAKAMAGTVAVFRGKKTAGPAVSRGSPDSPGGREFPLVKAKHGEERQ